MRRVRRPEWNFGGCGPSNDCSWGSEPAWRHYDELGPISSAFFAEWPSSVALTLLGAEVGENVFSGASLTDGAPATNPCRRAYIIYSGPQNHRSSWDPMTLLDAVRGQQSQWYAHAHAHSRVRVHDHTSPTRVHAHAPCLPLLITRTRPRPPCLQGMVSIRADG